MNAINIKKLLKHVHDNEATLTRVGAVEDALRKYSGLLSHAEVEVLLSALHVKRTELTVQF